jgi:hypothetical protein
MIAGVVRTSASILVRLKMKNVKYAAIAISSLMVAGIATVMFLARGTGEDITGVVAPALLIALTSAVVGIIAAVLHKRDVKVISAQRNNDLPA